MPHAGGLPALRSWVKTLYTMEELKIHKNCFLNKFFAINPGTNWAEKRGKIFIKKTSVRRMSGSYLCQSGRENFENALRKELRDATPRKQMCGYYIRDLSVS
jgi:hypothetical protein